MFCEWNKELKCETCGKVANNKEVRRRCTPGLGDVVASGLKAVGITEERVLKVTKRKCRCAKRRESLNKVGRTLSKAIRRLRGQ